MADAQKNNEKENNNKISRREFLKDAGLVVGGATVGSMAILNACGGGEASANTVTNTVTSTVTVTVAPTETAGTVKFILNGENTQVAVEPNWTLADVLRKKLGLMGTKIACNQGACGACTVLLDGIAVYSCMLLAVECDGKNVTTIEGLLNSDGSINKLQQAFADNFGFGCGFCTPGFILTAKALLDKNPNPTEEEINQSLSGNLCRCTGYTKIVESVQAAAKG